MDLIGLTELLETKRPERLARFAHAIGAELGERELDVLLELSNHVPYRWSSPQADPHNVLDHRSMPFVLGALLRVTRGTEEHVWERVDDRGHYTHVLIVRFERDGRWFVTVGVKNGSRSKLMGREWVEFAHWRPVLSDNRAALLQWAQRPGPDRITATMLEPPAAVATGGESEARFLRAIAERPDDDAPRQVFADWLEERGDARGELIRLQLALARKPKDAALAAQVTSLLTARWKELAGPLAKWTKGPSSFARGLVSQVHLNCAQLEKEGERLFTSFPLSGVVFDEPAFTPARLERLGRAKPLDLVRELTLFERILSRTPARPLAALAKGTCFASLRRLNLRVRGQSGADWKALFTGLSAPKLEHLDLRYIHTHHGIYEGLAAAAGLAALKRVTESSEGALPGMDTKGFARPIALLKKRGVTVERD